MQRPMTLVFLGDIVGAPGRLALQKHLAAVRERYTGAVVIANGENIRNGSGITPDLYRALRQAGVDAVTLGDHCFRDPRIVPLLEDPQEPILRPANLSSRAPGKRWIRIPAGGGRERSVFVTTVLGRIYFPLPANDPFSTADEILAEIPERQPIVVVEAHMEATSEKAALAHHLDGRVAAVLGTHTHVPTADARCLRGGTAFVTDLGMCGPYDSVIGRDSALVVRHMTSSLPSQYDVATGDVRVCGAVVEIDESTGLARRIERLEISDG
ncbi:MAG: YmdB family metallophosphoesterase [Phycisphaerae bacterium]|nr:YmdB family metallophosphoesterase [Phycisphaerae bacterium]